MTESQEMDVEALRTELDQIKDAMGIRERSPGAIRVWLVFGALVPVAAAISQYVFLERLSQFYHGVVWVGILGVGGYFGARRVFDGGDGWNAAGKPNLFVQFGAVYAAVFGVAYVVMGSSLRAYYIQRRDRLPFYVGGAWMVALGVAIPYSDFLMEWAYAVFGGLYLLYALGTYVVLRGDRE